MIICFNQKSEAKNNTLEQFKFCSSYFIFITHYLYMAHLEPVTNKNSLRWDGYNNIIACNYSEKLLNVISS